MTGSLLVPMLRCIRELHNREHDRNLEESADHGGEGRTGVQAEQADGGCNGEFKSWTPL